MSGGRSGATVAQAICNRYVGGSTPPFGSMSNRQAEPAGGPGQLAVEACASLSLLQPDLDSGGGGEGVIPPGCKLGALTGYAGSNPAPATRYEPTRHQGGSRPG